MNTTKSFGRLLLITFLAIFAVSNVSAQSKKKVNASRRNISIASIDYTSGTQQELSKLPKFKGSIDSVVNARLNAALSQRAVTLSEAHKKPSVTIELSLSELGEVTSAKALLPDNNPAKRVLQEAFSKFPAFTPAEANGELVATKVVLKMDWKVMGSSNWKVSNPTYTWDHVALKKQALVKEEARNSHQGLDEDKKVYTVVEHEPQFPGGPEALVAYISSQVKYPVEAQKQGIQGKVVAKVVILEDGSIGDVKVIQSLDPACDQEAVRVIKSLPRFEPGMQGGKKVKVWLTCPIRFHLP